MYDEIQVVFDYLRLECRSENRLIIRDGGSNYSPLISVIDGESTPSLITNTLIATSSQLLLEFNVTRSKEKGEDCVAGFVATISSRK